MGALAGWRSGLVRDLVRAPTTLIFNYCFRRIGDRETAKELLQVVFLEAWRHRDKELPPDKVLPWFYV